MIVWIVGAVLLANIGKGGTVIVSLNHFDSLFQKYGANYGIDWKILKAIAMNEGGLGSYASGLHPSVLKGLQNPLDVDGSKSSDGLSWGLMQVTLKTGRDFDPSVTPEKLNNPEYSVKIAAQILAWISVQFKTSDPRYWEWVIKSYNQGVGNTFKEMGGAASKAQNYWNRYNRNLSKLNEGAK